MVPLSGIVHPQGGTAECIVHRLTNFNAHGDAEATVFRLFQQHRTPMKGGGGADEQHPQAQAVAAVFDAGGAQIPGERRGPQGRIHAAAVVLNAQVQLVPVPGQLDLDGAAGRGELHGVGEHIVHGPLHFIRVDEGEDGAGDQIIFQLRPEAIGQRLQPFQNFGKSTLHVPQLRMKSTGGPQKGVGHIAQNPQHLEEPPVHLGDLILGVGIVGEPGKHPVGSAHNVGQGLAQFLSGQGHGLQGLLVLRIFQNEDVHVVYPVDGSTCDLPHEVQG